MAIRLLCTLVLLAGQATLGHAADDHARFVQAPSGLISATLVGAVDPCNGSVIFPMGTPSVDSNGNEFDITSPFAIADPPGCPTPPQPYEVSATLGTLADGTYTVVWTAGPLIVRGEFSVAAGVLDVPAAPVPTLDDSSMLVLIALLGVAASRALHRNGVGAA